MLASLGRLSEAIAAQEKGVELDPLSSGAWNFLGVYLTANQDPAAARKPLMRALEISPGSEFALSNLAVLDLLSGEASEALAAARQIHSSEWRLFSLALSEYSLGHTKESEQALQELISKHGNDSAYQVAEVYAWRGESDQAFKWLERAYRQRDNGIGTMQYSPLLSSVREDPRYGEMLRKAGLVQ